MKRITLACLLLFSVNIVAQQGINYKAVIKDGSGAIAASTAIGVSFIILDGAVNVYEETHAPTTDANGIVILNIGEGIPVTGTFSAIDWSSNNHFLNVQIDTGGGLQDMGTTAFKTVPYALHAKTAENTTNGTLDAAYDNGGSGAGRIITADAGEVIITSNIPNGIALQLNSSDTGTGLLSNGFNGVVGETSRSTGIAVYGENFDNIAPIGNGVGVSGKGYYGILGEDRYAGSISGAYGVFSNGNTGASGTKSFRIDHPNDPENKFLRHFSIESNEVLNIYRGTIAFDTNGEAIVELPDYFTKINKNTSYQLTPLGSYMALYIKEKVGESNQFVIAGGLVGKEVSWAVYAERNDLYLQNNPEQRKVELDKRPQEKGLYQIPSLYGEDGNKAMFKNQLMKVEEK